MKAFAAGLSVNYPVVMSNARARDGVWRHHRRSVDLRRQSDRAGFVQRHLGLLQGPRTEHEVRALAGLPTDATVETVKDTGQVLLDNAAYATEIPGIDLDRCHRSQRERTLKRLERRAAAPAAAGSRVAQCRINDPTCEVSLPVAKKILEERSRRSEHLRSAIVDCIDSAVAVSVDSWRSVAVPIAVPAIRSQVASA